ncbi:MAG: hypothetical protein AAF429_01755 [Pseudomonadota bacterium]
MPFTDQKFTEITLAMRNALDSGQLDTNARGYVQNVSLQFANKGTRVHLSERQMCALEDIIAPYQTDEVALSAKERLAQLNTDVKARRTHRKKHLKTSVMRMASSTMSTAAVFMLVISLTH